jgi:intracellular sulfur oxidation DsrE/DsrF family protein
MYNAQQALGLSAALFTSLALAAQPSTGPVIDNFGPVFDTPADAYNLAKDTHHRVRLDVSATGKSPMQRNPTLESAARFLNMHARRGIAPENMAFALVVHGAATRDLLTDAAYEARFDHPNPNTALLAALDKAGVAIYLCGQSAAYKQFGWGEFNPAVTIAVSAMTAHVRLEREGYAVIPF